MNLNNRESALAITCLDTEEPLYLIIHTIIDLYYIYFNNDFEKIIDTIIDMHKRNILFIWKDGCGNIGDPDSKLSNISKIDFMKYVNINSPFTDSTDYAVDPEYHLLADVEFGQIDKEIKDRYYGLHR